MSFARYNRLLNDISEKLEDYEKVKTIFRTARRQGWIDENIAIPKPKDDFAVFLDKLFKDIKVDIDDLSMLKEILQLVEEWPLSSQIEEFQESRKEFTDLLEEVISKLDMPDLQKLISLFENQISEDSEKSLGTKDIEDARALFKNLVKKKRLGPKELRDFLSKIHDKSKEEAVFDKLDDLAANFKLQEDAQRKKDQAFFKTKIEAPCAYLFRKAKAAGELFLNCDFNTRQGRRLAVTVGLILHGYNPAYAVVLEEAFNRILPLATRLLAAMDGSVRFKIHSEDRKSLMALREQYQDGTLQRKLQDFLVTEDIRQLANGEEVVLSLYIDPQDFKDALLSFIIAENQAVQTDEQELPGPARVRRISDSVPYVRSKQNEAKLIHAKLRQEEAKFRGQQLGGQEKDVEQIKSETGETSNPTEEALPAFKKSAADVEGRRKSAIPLCLPNNCDWKSGKCTKNGKERTSLYVIDEALEQLRRIKGPVCVVSIAGTYRKGKSYILSEAFDQPNVFTLGHEMEPETMGIWLWVVPDKYKDSHGREFTVVLLDSEGIDSLSNKGFEDHRIFTLTVLLASVFIYNSQGVPLRKDVEKLDFIAKLSKRIHIRSRPGSAYCTADKETELFHKTFPYFIWLLRDVTQSIPSDCGNIKDYFLKKVFNVKASVDTSHRCKKVCESILRFFPGFDAFMLPSPSVDPEIIRCINEKKCQVNGSFIDALDEFKNLIKTTVAPKHSPTDGEFVTGQGLAALVQLYVYDINTSGAIPNVQSTWDTYVEEKCREAKQTALGLYDDRLLEAQLSLSADELPCDSDYIRSSHTAALQECEHKFLSELDGFSTDIVEKHMGELKVSIESKLREWEAENKRQTREWCEGLMSVFKAKHFDPVLKRLQGKDAAELSFKDVIHGYNKIKDDYHSSARGARDVIATVFFEFHPKLKKEMDQQLVLLGQLKDFDEKRSRELAAKAYLESERKRLEEEQRRLQQENSQQKRQMEILINSLGDERKRFQEQLKDEQQAQQQQLQNMVAASINQAHEERQEFIKQRRYLNAQLTEMQEYNEHNMKKIKEMSEIAARHDKEKEELLQQVNSETDEEREALIMKMNDRHEQEMKVFRDEMNGKLNEVLASAPTIDKDMFRTPGLIKERTKAADDLRNKTKEMQKARQEIEKPGVLKTVMEFVS